MNSRSVLSSLSLLALVSACSADVLGSKGSLSADESAALAMQISSTIQSSAGSTAAASMTRVPSMPGLSLASSPVSLNLDTTVPCPLGGQTHLTLTVSGSVDQQAQTAALDLSGTNAPQDCGYHVKQATVHVTGTPSLTQTAHVSVDHGAPTGVQSFSSHGSFDWSTSDGRSGSCSLDYTATADYSTSTVTVNGTVCGTTIQYSGPLTPAA